MFSLQQNRRTRGWNRFCPLFQGQGGKEGEEVAKTMYIHVSKCKNDFLKNLVKEAKKNK
jgi:hypothetical protein